MSEANKSDKAVDDGRMGEDPQSGPALNDCDSRDSRELNPEIIREPLTLPFEEIRKADLGRVGGKGANLGELASAGFLVPGGFCVTTSAYALFLETVEDAGQIWQSLSSLDVEDVVAVRRVGKAVRAQLTQSVLPEAIRMAVLEAWQRTGPDHAYAVRSSATAEDLPDASFAGQQDTYLNVCGEDALLKAVQACWGSLFTDRAIVYRVRNHFDHREVLLSVVVQRMVFPDISGIMFTADPVTGHRRQVVIEASYGLGEALVSGLVTPDRYLVHKDGNRLLETTVSKKLVAIRPVAGGGVRQEDVPETDQTKQVLDEAEIQALAALGMAIETHYEAHQDIEWARKGGEFFILQARPITSLYPLPEPGPTNDTLRIYFCFNHLQVMLDPMSPLALSTWQTVISFGRPEGSLETNPYVPIAAGRLFVDVTPVLLRSIPRKIFPKVFNIVDRLIALTLVQFVKRPEFLNGARDPRNIASISGLLGWFVPFFSRIFWCALFTPPETVLERGNRGLEAELEGLETRFDRATDPAARVHAIRQELSGILKRFLWLFPPLFVPGLMAMKGLKTIMKGRVSEKALAALGRGLTGNVTTEMDLAVGDLADTARAHPEVIQVLKNEEEGDIRTRLQEVAGGQAFLSALDLFLDRYGMRGPSEIDIARPRWRDNPASLLQMVAGNLSGPSGGHRAHHATMAREGDAEAAAIVRDAGFGLLGPVRRMLVGRFVRMIRHNTALREHPKFAIIRTLDLIRTRIEPMAEQLVSEGRMEAVGDIYALGWEELEAALSDPSLEIRTRIEARKQAQVQYARLKPPRLMTSEGETPLVTYDHAELPEGALPGTPVSFGVVEGVARVITDPTTEVLQAGEILVAPFTDPGWTPLFVNARALVMEVGGTMTHGSVVAREYGLPAVVGVEHATQHIRTGQRLRVDGTRGWVELLDGGENS